MQARNPRAFVLLLERAGTEADDGPPLVDGMRTQDARMKEVLRIIERVAAHDDTILVSDDTGSLERDHSARINCAALRTRR